MEPQVRFCTASDGVRIAYATTGEGPPIVSVPVWFSTLKYEALEPRYASFHQQLAANRQLVRYDRRGTGMSDRNVTDFSRGALVKDLEAVIDHLKLRRVVLFAGDMAGPVAVEYAFRHPDKVSHLILYGCFARGQDIGTPEAGEALIRLFRAGWEIGSEIIPVLIMPGADPDTARRYFTALRESCAAAAAAAQLEAVGREDVTELLPQIKVPTLVVHARHDRAFPFELGRQLASLMPNARLVALDLDVHFDLSGGPAILQAINEFLAPPERRAKAKPVPNGTRVSGLVTILFTDMEGSTTLTQRLGDEKAQDLVRAHNTVVRDALKACGGAEIKHTGDGIMASFPSASRALECAIAIQRAFDERNRGVGAHHDAPLHVRIGLNAGEPVAEEEDLFGAAVQLARRICDHAQPGQVLVSNVVRELAMGKGFLFADSGDVVLKGFEDPVRLYEVRWQEG
ncbi:MAG: adenylate/guanylate cyclase domain-containing protein [Chloroflexi bacterium]|nr:adenylate/guanylate cyclase domain-containing protein [Chloroflexota bacterium]